MKTCTKCLEEKPISDFYKQEGRKQGASSRCKACIAESYTQKKDDPFFIDYNRKKSRDFYKNNKEYCLEWHKNYRDSNREKISKYQKQYREQNKERIYSQGKLYRRLNNEKIKAQRAEYRKSDQYKNNQKTKRERMLNDPRKYYKKYRHNILLKARIETAQLSDKHIVKIICQRKQIDRNCVTKDLIELKRSHLQVCRDTNQLIETIKEKQK